MFLNNQQVTGISLVAQTIKHLPTMWETQVQSLGWEDPLEKGMETHSIFFPGESGWATNHGVTKSQIRLHSHFPNRLLKKSKGKSENF